MLKLIIAILLLSVGLSIATDYGNLTLVGLEHLTEHLATIEGYPIEEYYVTTSDGYILKVYRIPGSPRSPPAHGKTVVFLQHGLLCSSSDWLVLGKDKSIAYLLADEGYDVWLGNARGNTNSRHNVYLNPDQRAFWEFTWDEIGRFDLPSMIDLALSNTGQQDLHYIGHSQGTTSFFVMASELPEMNAKIRSMHAFAPVAHMTNLVSPLIRVIAPFTDELEIAVELLGSYEFLPSNKLLTDGGQLVCKNESPIKELCSNVLFILCGFDSQQLDPSLIPILLETTPAGASIFQIVHYGQLINTGIRYITSGSFRQFDHGIIRNLLIYGSIFPPDYNLNRITAKVYLHYSGNDWFAAVKDVEYLATKIRNSVLIKVSDPKFNHLDFTYARDADTILYNDVIRTIKNS